jgi:uncharacterized membrane protein YvlD (DUF360 family)
MGPRRTMVMGVGIFVLIVVSLQIFLIMVGLEAWITFDSRVAWGAAIASIALALVSLLLYRYLVGSGPRRGPTQRPTRTRQGSEG